MCENPDSYGGCISGRLIAIIQGGVLCPRFEKEGLIYSGELSTTVNGDI